MLEGVGWATFGLAIEHVVPRGVVNIATQTDDETGHLPPAQFDRARGAKIYTLNLFDELASHLSAPSDLPASAGCLMHVDARAPGARLTPASWMDLDGRCALAWQARTLSAKPRRRRVTLVLDASAVVSPQPANSETGSPRPGRKCADHVRTSA